MAKIMFMTFALIVLFSFLNQSSAAGGECPTSNQVYSCSPKCIADTDCSYGKKCCPNNCNTKSCSETKTSGTSGGSKGSSAGGSGSYCNNVKCNSYEKCELDRTTKRMKCVRA